MRLVVQTNIFGGHHLWLLNERNRVLQATHPRHAHHGADHLLAEITKLIGRRRLTSITVVRGPGAFTAIRAALVVTNMLAWLRNIPINGMVRKDALTTKELARLPAMKTKKFSVAVRPWYGRGPNITVPKKRR